MNNPWFPFMRALLLDPQYYVVFFRYLKLLGDVLGGGGMTPWPRRRAGQLSATAAHLSTASGTLRSVQDDESGGWLHPDVPGTGGSLLGSVGWFFHPQWTPSIWKSRWKVVATQIFLDFFTSIFCGEDEAILMTTVICFQRGWFNHQRVTHWS